MSTQTRPDQDQDQLNPAQSDYAAKFERDFGNRPTLNEGIASEEGAIDQAKARLRSDEDAAAEATAPKQKTANADNLQSREAQPQGFYAGGKTSGAVKGLANKTLKRWLLGAGAGLITGGVTASVGGMLGIFVSLKEMSLDFYTKNHYSFYSKRTKVLQDRIFNKPEACGTISIKCRLKKGISDKEIEKYKKAGLSPEVGEENGKKYIKSFTTTGDDGKPIKIDKSNFGTVYDQSAKFRSQAWVISKPQALVWRAQHAVNKFNVFRIARNKLFSKAKDFRKYVYGGGRKDVRTKPSTDADDAESDASKAASEVDDSIDKAAREITEELAANDYEKAPSVSIDVSSLDSTAATEAAAKGAVSGGLKGAVLGVFNTIDRACSGYQILRTVEFGAKVLKYQALIQYSMIFMTHADAIKAGDISPEQIALVAGILVTPSTLSGSKGKTAANSNLYSLITQGKVSSRSGLAYGVIGTAALKAVSTAKDALENVGANKATCSKIKSWPAQVGLALGGLTLTVLSGSGNAWLGIAVGVGLSAIIAVLQAYAIPLLIQYVAGTVAPDPNDPGGGYVAGEAIAAGLGGMAAELGKGGMRPLKTEEAIAVINETNAEMAKIKEADHVDKSPFSLDSADSITSKLAIAAAPYVSAPTSQSTYQDLSSLAVAPLQMIGNSINQLFNKKVGALSTSYGGEYCVDEDLRSMGILTDAYCNPVYGRDDNTTTSAEYTPEAVVDYMVDNGHVNESDGSPKSDDYKKYLASCVEGTTPITPDGGGVEVTDDSVDTRICVKTDTQTTMFGMFYADTNILDGMDDSANGTLGAPTSYASTTTGSTLSIEACNGSIPAGDNIKILCEALKYDAYGYEWGAGHGGTAAGFAERFASGEFIPNESKILDCSSLVRMSIWDAFKVDIPGSVATMFPQTKYFQKISLEEAKPGDLFTTTSMDHTGIIVENHTDAKKFDIFHASTGKGEIANQILQSTRSYSGTNAYRYIGPKND
ncbi:MAG: NlpC/P60 family protein [Candidatus Woesebacteria bacterium]|jgi:hypothetical protein